MNAMTCNPARAARTAFLMLVLLPQPARPQAVDTARVDRLFRQWDTTQSPGCAVGVAADGRTLLARAWGMADLEHDIPNTAATIFEAGSVSKQFTAAAVILLAQQGRLTLDDDVRTHVPELPDYGPTITIRHLLTHTSGLRDWGSVAAIAGWGRGVRTHTHDHVLDILARQRGLNFEPGAEYSYSNSGYNLLAIIVSRVSGSSFADFSRTHIFEPLGMKDTQWRDDYRRIARGRASAYAAAETTIRVVVEDGNLAAYRRPATRMPLSPWARDVFDGAIGRITFIRDESGRVVQFSVFEPRVYDLRFDRQP
jgi:CubicO group peptidase (beta-lactamase class C family)